MTREEAIKDIRDNIKPVVGGKSLDMAIEALEQEPIDKSAMMYEIYMESVNMSGEYQGCWVRFKDIEKIVDKYIGDKK